MWGRAISARGPAFSGSQSVRKTEIVAPLVSLSQKIAKKSKLNSGHGWTRISPKCTYAWLFFENMISPVCIRVHPWLEYYSTNLSAARSSALVETGVLSAAPAGTGLPLANPQQATMIKPGMAPFERMFSPPCYAAAKGAFTTRLSLLASGIAKKTCERDQTTSRGTRVL